MANKMAVTRLRREYQNLQKDPPPGIIAEPKESDLLVCFYAFRGPTDTPYQGGQYVGKLKFPPEYPMKAPSVYMLTPSGRYATNTKICMSMSDFHPEQWNPAWSVASIVQGVQSFMASDELTTGGLKAPDAMRRQLAAESVKYNQQHFSELFGGNVPAALQRSDEAAAAKAKAAAAANARKQARRITAASRNSTKSKSTAASSNQKEEEVTKKEEDVQEETADELTPEEMEKRRKRNAKKRAKQKAKKAAAAAEAANNKEETDLADNVDKLDIRE